MAQNDIINNEDVKIKVMYNNQLVYLDDLSDEELVTYLDDRFNDMKSADIRKKAMEQADRDDKQFTALSIRDNYNNLKVNLPMEQNLIDTYEGRASGKIIFDIQPDGKQADVNELQPAQYATEFYLEGGDNKGNGFYDEAPIIRRQKAKYGTTFAFVGLENNKSLKYKIKKDAQINTISDLENKDNYEPYIMDAWELFPKYIPFRSVYVDEKALNQSNIQKAEDMFIEKNISLSKINFMRGDKNSGYKNIDKLSESNDNEDIKRNKDEFSRNQSTIRFYFNNLTKDYVVYSSENKVILHHSKMLYNHNKLPIESAQHYSDDNCLYGISIPKKIMYLKGYKSEIMQSILDNAAQSSGLNFIVGNDGTIENRNVGGNGVNVWRTSTGAEQIKQMQPQINSGLISILNILDDLVVQDTGENIRATIDPNSDKVGIVEMMEENKAIRHKSVDENWNIFLDKILTMMLSNIAQFVPQLLSRTVEVGSEGHKVTKIEYPYIRIKDASVTKKGNKIIIDKVDNMGKLGYMELEPGTISEGLGVKVVTPSTTNSLPMVKKDNISKRIDNKLNLAQIAALDQSGQLMEQLKSTINLEELNQWMNDVYGFEDKLKSMTGKDKIREANKMKIEKLKKLIESGNNVVLNTNNQLQNEQIPANTMTNENINTGGVVESQGNQDKQITGGEQKVVM